MVPTEVLTDTSATGKKRGRPRKSSPKPDSFGPKRPRGRPRLSPKPKPVFFGPSRPRGRPKKYPPNPVFAGPKRPRGRPRKSTNTLMTDSESEDTKEGILSNGRPLSVQNSGDTKDGILPSGHQSSAVTWTVKHLHGDLPPFSDWAKRAVDRVRNRVYIYGGRRQHEDWSRPDFYCCHVSGQMTWTNLTDQVKYCDPYANYFTGSHVFPTHKRLPTLFCPSITFVTIKDQNFVMLFGGLDEECEDNGPTNTLIAVDVDRLIWFYVPLTSEPGIGQGPARMNAAMVAFENQLFIFGGRAGLGEPEITSYSAIRCNEDGSWSWVIDKCEYPSDLPPLGYDLQAVATYGGLKVLLLPGKTDNESPIDIEPERMVFFHTSNLKFSVAHDAAGSFPTNLAWYHSFLLNPRPPLPSRRNFEQPSTQVVPGNPSVIICGWTILDGENPDGSCRLSIEVWRYRLTPEDRMECLHVGDITSKYQQEDFEDAVVVGERLFLLGSKKDDDEWDGSGAHAMNIEDESESSELDDDDSSMSTDDLRSRYYNVRMEVPLS